MSSLFIHGNSPSKGGGEDSLSHVGPQGKGKEQRPNASVPASPFQMALGQQQQLTKQKREEAPSMHHGGNIGTYMQLKNAKLREQFEANSFHAGPASNIFQGVSIFVNGYTQPTHAELRQIMLMHGGRFETYLYRDRVTHYVCQNLPDVKIKMLAHERNPLPIVRPEWVTASLKVGRVLPVHDFQLSAVCNMPRQRRLMDFKQHATTSIAPEQLYPQLAHKNQQQQQQQQQPHDPLQSPSHSSLQQQQQSAHPKQHPPPQQFWHPQQQQQLIVPPVSAACEDRSMEEAQALCAKLRAECDLLRGAPRSSREDLAFMDSYFKSSRLHHIGTWKTRIEALMAEGEMRGPSPLPVQGSRIQQGGTLLQFMHPPGHSSSSTSNLPPFPAERAIIHLDMDCFFAAASVVDYPVLRGKPLVVCHSSSAKGTGEISAASYEARAYGVRAVMSIGEAKRLCPHLLVVPYMFDKYAEISDQVYRILMRYTSCVQALSCDEAYLDVTGLGDPVEMAAAIRAEIFATTQCTASAGIGPNMLLARIATVHGKPNGQFRVPSGSQALEFLGDLSVMELPGVGGAAKGKLEDLGITRVRQVWSASRERLQRHLGAKSGQALWQYAHGRDDRCVEPPKVRKSVGAEVNWGIRFDGPEGTDKFLQDLAAEVAQRMKAAGVRGKGITLKLKRRQEGAPMPWKCLGHGPCDSLSRSVTVGSFTAAAADILREARALYLALRVPDAEVRGLGIVVNKLDCEGAVHASARPSVHPPAKLRAPRPTPFQPKEKYASLSDRPISSPPPGFGSPSHTSSHPTSTKSSSPPLQSQPPPSPPSAPRSPFHTMPITQVTSPKPDHTNKHPLCDKPTHLSPFIGTPTPPPILKPSELDGNTSCHAPAAAAAETMLARTAALPADAADAAGIGNASMALGQASAHMTASSPVPSTPPAQHASTCTETVVASHKHNGCATPSRPALPPVPDGARPGAVLDAPTCPAAVHTPAVSAAHRTAACQSPASGAKPRTGASRGEQVDTRPGPYSETDVSKAKKRVRPLNATAASAPAHSGADSGAGTRKVRQQAPLALMPPASDLDPEVLQALPLELRREIEAAYGIGSPRQSSRRPGPSKQQQLLPKQQPKRKRQPQQPTSANPQSSKLRQTTLASSFSGAATKPAHSAATNSTHSAAATAHNSAAVSCRVNMHGAKSRPQHPAHHHARQSSHQTSHLSPHDSGSVGRQGGDAGGSEGAAAQPHSWHENEGRFQSSHQFKGQEVEQARGQGEGKRGRERGKGLREREAKRHRFEREGQNGYLAREDTPSGVDMEADSPLLPDGGEEQLRKAQLEWQSKGQRRRRDQTEADSALRPGGERAVEEEALVRRGQGLQQHGHQWLQHGWQQHKQPDQHSKGAGGVSGCHDQIGSAARGSSLMEQLHHMTSSQVDPSVLAQLPLAMQQEVTRVLKPKPKQTTAAALAPRNEVSGPAPRGVRDASSTGGVSLSEDGSEAQAGGAARTDAAALVGASGSGVPSGQAGAGKGGSASDSKAGPCTRFMAQPPSTVRRDFREYLRARAREVLHEVGARRGRQKSVSQTTLTVSPNGLQQGQACQQAADPASLDALCVRPEVEAGSPGHPHAAVADDGGHGAASGGKGLADGAPGAIAEGIHSAASSCQDLAAPDAFNGVALDGAHEGATLGACGVAANGCTDTTNEGVDIVQVPADVQSACARMEDWALAHSGNLEETGKTLGALEGLCKGTELPGLMEQLVQGMLSRLRFAVHARYGVHLLAI